VVTQPGMIAAVLAEFRQVPAERLAFCKVAGEAGNRDVPIVPDAMDNLRLGPEGLESSPNSPGNTQITPDVVLRVVLSALERLDSNGRERVLERLQTLAGRE